MVKFLLFGLLSLPVILVSRRSLLSPGNHGFYRFFSWECILWLLVNNVPFWIEDPLSFRQIISWLLLFSSIYYVAAGTTLLVKKGRPDTTKERDNLYSFEKTTELVDKGIYRYIRHPLYGSLLLLTWGVFLKHTTPSLFLISFISTLFLYLTALADEKECISYFGWKYLDYMKRSKRFIPFVF
jgi:protein-S-isoprenylcysteine O-methyltransferase Ste14